jgi:hypothetical protein
MMTNAPITSEAILVNISYIWTTLFYSLICVQLAKATLILKQREYLLMGGKEDMRFAPSEMYEGRRR